MSETILEEAQRLVHGDRQASYGHPYDDYTCTARIWEAILNLPPYTITPHKACLMMVGVKLSRESRKSKRDNLTDMAGYAECASMCHDRAVALEDS